MSNSAKNYSNYSNISIKIILVNLFYIIQQVFYIIILIIQNYFSDPYISKIANFKIENVIKYVKLHTHCSRNVNGFDYN